MIRNWFFGAGCTERSAGEFLTFMVGQYDSAVDAYMARLALEAHWKQHHPRPAKPAAPETKP